MLKHRGFGCPHLSLLPFCPLYLSSWLPNTGVSPNWFHWFPGKLNPFDADFRVRTNFSEHHVEKKVSHSTKTKASSVEVCIPCEAGSYSNESWSSCLACPAGRYSIAMWISLSFELGLVLVHTIHWICPQVVFPASLWHTFYFDPERLGWFAGHGFMCFGSMGIGCGAGNSERVRISLLKQSDEGLWV